MVAAGVKMMRLWVDNEGTKKKNIHKFKKTGCDDELKELYKESTSELLDILIWIRYRVYK